jgi:Major capsid protein N-terminus/Large eukaryotic DNA virus major capsid protein
MSSNTSSSNLTAAFIDLATYDEPEKYMYGGDQAITYFVKKARKATWFSIAPTVLSISGGNPGFGQSWGHKISRAGDYLLRTWLRVSVPSVTLANAPNGWNLNDCALRWTRNLGHNLIKEINLSFNDLVAERMDSYYLDFWAAFTVPAGKANGYNNMIGNVAELVDPLSVVGPAAAVTLPAYVLNIPLPFFYARDTGIALPTAAIPYNDMIHYVTFRDINELLIVDNFVLGLSDVCQKSYLANQSPQLNCDMWAEYAIVSNVERSQMGKAPRDILMEQVQTAPKVQYNPSNNANIDIRFAHSVKALFFAIRNKTNPAEQSNYTAAQPVPKVTGVNFAPALATDPIAQTSLFYENTARLVNMGSDYFSLVVPYYSAISIPRETGYHLLSYTLDLINTNPMGSTNYGKLTNVSFQFGASQDAVTSAAGGAPVSGAPVPQQFETIVVGVNHNIVRVSGGRV